jgi:gamma-glutamyl hydrolase
MVRVLTWSVLGLGLIAAVCALNDRPVFGILSAPAGIDEDGAPTPYPGKYYIPASYIKFVESSGARAVPIMFDISDEELVSLYGKLNGLLVPGGGSDLSRGSRYRNLTSMLLNMTMASAANGQWVPMWGTCLGFEAIMVDAANDINVLTNFNSENISLPLQYTGVCQTQACRMFGASFPENVLELFANSSLQIAFNNHAWGVSPTNFTAYPSLAQNFRMLATSTDRDGKQFVAAAEHNRYPIYATQFHPEKPIFEWNEGEVIPHTGNAVAANIYLSTFLVGESRKNTHKFASEQEYFEYSINNYNPTFTGAGTSGDNMFDQCYFFNGTASRGKGRHH